MKLPDAHSRARSSKPQKPGAGQRRRPGRGSRRPPPTWSAGSTSAPGGASFLTGMLFRKVPKGTNWFYTLGSATLFAFVVQAVTGVFLAMYYTPSADPGLRLDHPPHQRRLPRRVRARHAQVGRQRDDHPDLPPHGADLRLRRLQVPARAELGDRRRAPDPDHGHGLHRLPAALRPALLLGHGRRQQHHRDRAGSRPLPGRLPARRARSSSRPRCRASTRSTCCSCPG